jgi:hypothetical protein
VAHLFLYKFMINTRQRKGHPFIIIIIIIIIGIGDSFQ